jgi:hypothetical protein
MYFITCFQKYEIDKKTGVPDIGAERTFGYYPYKEWAVEDLHDNNCDIHEDLYNYAVIEKIPTGLYPLAEERIFFKWDEEEQGFYEIDGADMQDCFGNYAFG